MRRTTELGLASFLLVLASPLIKGEELRATVPGYWVMAPVLVWAVHWHWRGGLTAGAIVTVADLSVRQSVTQGNYGNVFLLLVDTRRHLTTEQDPAADGPPADPTAAVGPRPDHGGASDAR